MSSCITPHEAQCGSSEENIYREFENRVNNFVDVMLKEYTPNDYKHNKVIHDPVWGTTLFYPWELKILDSPLLQRLRRINQVGLAVLTYPSAHHSRFEHTLGVMSVATKMVNNINQENCTERDNDSKHIISDADLYKIRFAAMMHDVGHCFFSHLSETIYGNLTPFKELKRAFEIFNSAKEHEIFSYIIVTCKNFKDFVKNKVSCHRFQVNEQFFTDIGKMIVGAFLAHENVQGSIPEKKYYLTQIINGQFDADKLDYLRRDSYTAGLALTYDIERFLYKIKIEGKSEGGILGKHLTIPISGVSAVEEMVFSQLMLSSYIYQHHKVLATEALIQDVVEGLVRNDKLRHPCDFLYYCDDNIYNIFNHSADKDFDISISAKIINSNSQKTLSTIVKRIKTRDLPKRAFIINSNTVENQYKVIDIANSLRGIATLRQSICEEAQKISNFLTEEDGGNKFIDTYDIYISIPRTSIVKDLSGAFVMTFDHEFVKLSEIVRLSDWADAFSYHKWSAYIFARSDICPIVGVASRIVLSKNGIKFNEDKIYKGLKIENEIKAIEENLKRRSYVNI